MINNGKTSKQQTLLSFIILQLEKEGRGLASSIPALPSPAFHAMMTHYFEKIQQKLTYFSKNLKLNLIPILTLAVISPKTKAKRSLSQLCL